MAFLDTVRFGTDLWDPSNRFETSWLLPPCILFACRALISLYAFTTIFFSLGWQCTNESAGGCEASRRTFSYFTTITFWGIACYFAVAAVHTFTYIRSGGRRSLLARFPRPLQALHSLFYTSIVTLPPLVTIVYWAILFPGRRFLTAYDTWSNVSEHAFNTVFAVFEIFFARTLPPLWIHVVWLILILALYLSVAYITLATQGWYTYSFLDHDYVGGRGYVAAYVFGIAAAIIVVFVVVWGLIRLRVWVTEKKFGMEGKFAAGRRYGDQDAELGTIKLAKPAERDLPPGL